ncbi:hypothetical protein OIU77_001287 [Salix suchowensis]|uniref:Uncharacterized protein n=1 Tax=Salix suchowensis TaxID=1278906 RepID=A0ABQ9B136_9ROSI|nr:hypothetical protein OIU77_001287 [Salix suchowensis]
MLVMKRWYTSLGDQAKKSAQELCWTVLFSACLLILQTIRAQNVVINQGLMVSSHPALIAFYQVAISTSSSMMSLMLSSLLNHEVAPAPLPNPTHRRCTSPCFFPLAKWFRWISHFQEQL